MDIAVARELTKLHEEIVRGTISEAAAHFTSQPPKGEITLVIAGAPERSDQWTLEQVQVALRDGITQGASPSSLAREIAVQSGWKRRTVYQLALEIEQQSDLDA